MNCIKCGAALNDGAKFCNVCGAPQDAGPSKCVKCGAELNAGARFCDACGSPQVATQVQSPPPQAPAGIPVPPGLPPRKLVKYRMLALFLGSLGVHDFYAGYTVRGVCKLVLFLIGGLYGILALVDIFTVTADAYGRPMEDTVPKNLLTYRLLALFLGFTGAHNFYSGHLGLGLAKLLLCWSGISTLWSLVEICVVKKDANGNPMEMPPNVKKVGMIFFILSLVLVVGALAIPVVCWFSSGPFPFVEEPVGFVAGIAILFCIAAMICGRRIGLAGILLAVAVTVCTILLRHDIAEYHDVEYNKQVEHRRMERERMEREKAKAEEERKSELSADKLTLVKYHGLDPEYTIPQGVTTIGKSACERNYKLKRVVIPEGVTTIGKRAFAGCENLESVKFPSTLKIIDEEAFSYCKKLEYITLPEGLETIGGEAFSNNYGLGSYISIPKSVKKIGFDAFKQSSCERSVAKYRSDYSCTIDY